MKSLKTHIWHPIKKQFVEVIEFLEDSLTDERLTLKQEPPFVVQLGMEK